MDSVILQRRGYSNRQIRLAFVATIGLSAFLLFQIQPLFSKMALPLLGGSPIVWNTAMVFFQTLLLLGYLYAHFLVRLPSHVWQVGIHIGLCFTAFLFLPFAVAEWFPVTTGAAAPILLFGLYLVSIGLPFLAISANAPLIQSWFSRTHHPDAGNPYFLYSASNVGSALALLSYPFIVEPRLTLTEQALFWTAGFFVLVFLLIEIGTRFSDRVKTPSVHADNHAHAAAEDDRSSVTQKARWVLLAFVPAAMMLGVTNLITLDLVSIPLFWIVPLLLYLITFVIAFSDHPSRPHSEKLRKYAQLAALACLVVALVPKHGIGFMAAGIAVLLGGFFVVALYLHSRLAESRPRADRLTGFYVLQSFGGVLGGATVTLFAPLIFSNAIEFLWLLVMAASLTVVPNHFSGARRLLNQYGAVAFMVCAILAVQHITEENVIAVERSYFGVHKVRKLQSEDGLLVTKLSHGSTLHGAQISDGIHDYIPQTYYVPESGAGSVLSKAPETANIAVVGLGTGSLSCYAKPQQNWTYFEIDPTVIRIAQDTRYFRFIDRCKPDTEFVPGDARISLKQAGNGEFDYLVIDAFSSDSIPIHLLTTEAIALYRKKLTEDGVLLLHISNRYFELAPILARNGADLNYKAFQLHYKATPDDQSQPMAQTSLWIAMVNHGDINHLSASNQWERLKPDLNLQPWTDDYSDILATIRIAK